MRIEDIAKAIGAALAITGFFWTAFEYIQTRQIEAAQPFLEKKLEWCEEAVDLASKLAVTLDPTKKDVKKFSQLFWGKMGMIENKTVKNAMVGFAVKFDSKNEHYIRFQSGSQAIVKIKDKGSDTVNEYDPSKLPDIRVLSLEIAEACRNELANEWSPSWLRPNTK